MKLKALLLGSAAAMIAVTGARAADAVIAEPEPVEYVRVCDLYGAKWFYLPGTETCIQFDGYVRLDAGYNDYDGALFTSGIFGEESDAYVGYRTRLNVRARNETDYGTLEGWMRLQGTGEFFGDATTTGLAGTATNPGDANLSVDRALISLAGLRMGYSDSFVTTHHGYGLYNDRNDGYYDYHQAIFIDYTYAANGFSATAGLQVSGGSFGDTGFNVAAGTWTGNTDADEPDPYAGISYTASWGGIAASVIYDNGNDDTMYKISADLNVIEGLKIRGWYMGDDGDSKYVSGGYGSFFPGANSVDQQYGIGMEYKFTDTLAFRVGYTAFDTDATKLAAELTGRGFNAAQQAAIGTDGDYVIVGLDWRPVPGLIVRPEATFDEYGEQYNLRVYRTF